MGSLSKAGFTWKGGYSMSKAALECMTEVLRSEMMPLGVQVINCHIGERIKLSVTRKSSTTNSTLIDSFWRSYRDRQHGYVL